MDESWHDEEAEIELVVKFIVMVYDYLHTFELKEV